MGKLNRCTPQEHRGSDNIAGICDARRAINNDRVTDYPERLAYRTAQCEAGDSYSCGVKSALELEFALREESVQDTSRLRPGDRAIRVDQETHVGPNYNRGTVVADSKGQCGSYKEVVAFRPDSFVAEGAYQCVFPSELLSRDQLRRSNAALERLNTYYSPAEGTGGEKWHLAADADQMRVHEHTHKRLADEPTKK